MWYEMEIIQGQDYEVTFSAHDPETDAPLDLRTGFTFVGRVCKTTDKDSPELYVFPVDATGLYPQNGSLIVRVPGTVSDDWDFERVVFGIKVTNNDDGREIMGIRGPLHVIPTVA
jgi:hypothetical protein